MAVVPLRRDTDRPKPPRSTLRKSRFRTRRTPPWNTTSDGALTERGGRWARAEALTSSPARVTGDWAVMGLIQTHDLDQHVRVAGVGCAREVECRSRYPATDIGLIVTPDGGRDAPTHRAEEPMRNRCAVNLGRRDSGCRLHRSQRASQVTRASRQGDAGDLCVRRDELKAVEPADPRVQLHRHAGLGQAGRVINDLVSEDL